MLEGPRVIEEALDAGEALEEVYLGPGVEPALVARAGEAGVPVHQLAPGVVEGVADTVTPQPVLGVARRVDVPLERLRDADLVVVCIDLRDPGNLGTVLRTAEAAGVGGVVCCDGSVDPYNPKCVRASAGSLFHVPVVAGGRPEHVLDRLGEWGVQRLGTAARRGVDYTRADLRAPTAFVLGNEGWGLPGELSDAVDGWVTIPMAGRTESLNVGVAAAVLCFEAARQRRP